MGSEPSFISQFLLCLVWVEQVSTAQTFTEDLESRADNWDSAREKLNIFISVYNLRFLSINITKPGGSSLLLSEALQTVSVLVAGESGFVKPLKETTPPDTMR